MSFSLDELLGAGVEDKSPPPLLIVGREPAAEETDLIASEDHLAALHDTPKEGHFESFDALPSKFLKGGSQGGPAVTRSPKSPFDAPAAAVVDNNVKSRSVPLTADGMVAAAQQILAQSMAVYLTAWQAAQLQAGSFLYPRPVFENARTGSQLLDQVSAMTSFVWLCESRVKDQLIKAEVRACYVAMRDEAVLVSQVEDYLKQSATPATKSSIERMRKLIRCCRDRNFAHEAITQLEAKLNLLSEVHDANSCDTAVKDALQSDHNFARSAVSNRKGEEETNDSSINKGAKRYNITPIGYVSRLGYFHSKSNLPARKLNDNK